MNRIELVHVMKERDRFIYVYNERERETNLILISWTFLSDIEYNIV